MRKFKRLTMTLALLIMAVGGAWAQSSLDVVELKVPTNWEGDHSYMTVADLTGFKAVTLDEAKAWKGAPKSDAAMLLYAFDDENAYYVAFDNGAVLTDSYAPFEKDEVFGNSKTTKFYYTAEPEPEITEWELKPDMETGKNWILAEMPASDIELQVEYEPTKVTMAANDNAMGTVEVAGESKVEWTADTWNGWTFNTKEYTVDDITMTSSKNAYIQDYTKEGKYLHSLDFFVDYSDNSSTVTFSTTGAPFSRIEFTMLDDYDEYNPHILPLDNWTFEGKSAVWEGEATKSLTLQSCTTDVSKITFFKGDIPDGVTVNGDGTFTVAKTATVTLKATPAEGYKFLYWEDDQTNTNPVREVTIESGMADMTYKAVFAEITYNVTFVEGTNLNEWTATPNTEVKKDTKVDIKYTGTKKVLGVKVEKVGAGPLAAAFKDGAKFKVGYQWNFGYTTYLEFTNSGGTYSLTSVSGLNEANGFNSSTLTVKNGNVLALDVVCQPNGDRMDEFCAQIEFDATSSTYKYSSKGSNFTGIISVSVNDTDITSQLTKEN